MPCLDYQSILRIQIVLDCLDSKKKSTIVTFSQIQKTFDGGFKRGSCHIFRQMRLSPDALFLSPATWHTATLLLAVLTAPLKWNACTATWQRDCSEGATRRISVFPHDALESGVVGVRSNCHRYVTSTPTRADSLVTPGRTTTTKKKSNLLTFKWYSRQSVLKVRVKKELWYRLQSERRRRLKIWGRVIQEKDVNEF